MKYRKLRIAWSVAWGVVAVLLIALWVRSYWYIDVLWFKASQNELYYAISQQGQFGGIVLPDSLVPGQANWWFGHVNVGAGYELDTPYGSWRFIPQRSIILLIAAFIAVPWVPRRFGLRTLLIATTLVAIGLGLIVWLR
jgi:hypothetical protein